MKKYSFLLEALSPISHGDTQTSINNNTNVRLFMRQNVIVNGIPSRIPTLSENSIRSVIFRKTLAEHLVSVLNIVSLPKTVVNLLFSGGNLMSGAKSPAGEFALGKALMSYYPSLELLSGSVDSFILPEGKLRPCLWPVTSEYARFLERVAPSEVIEESKNISIFDLTQEETRTRGTGGESEGNQMLFTYETLSAGAKFFVLAHLNYGVSELCESAFCYAVKNWSGYFGGQGRQGRGLMSVSELDFSGDGLAYSDYIEENKEKLKIGLEDGTFCTGTVLCGGK